MKLKEYKEKRDFSKTKEPKNKGKAHKNPIFVVQHHFSRREHYDFRLEFGGVLLSWAVPKGVPTTLSQKRLAVKVEDHPISYAKFSGTIEKGQYGAGKVEIYDNGTYTAKESFKKGLKSGMLKFHLSGKKIVGDFALIRTNMDKKQENWLLIKEKTNRNPFSKVDVKLAKLSYSIPKDDKNYAYEVKFDGYRIVAYIENGKVRLMTRNNIDYTSKFKDIVLSLKKIPGCAVLDGEVIVCDEKGRSDFKLLHKYLRGEKNFVPIYMVFDILSKDGKDLRNEKYIQRKEILRSLFSDCNNVIYTSYVVGQGNKNFKLAQKLDLEGIIGKKIDSVYKGTRDDDWIKVKCNKIEEFIVGGYTQSHNSNGQISSLLLGEMNENKLEFVGRVGTGFNDSDKALLKSILDKQKRKISPFNTTLNHQTDEKIIFTSPKLVVMVQFAEFTEEGLLRHASFKGIRNDKESVEVVRNTVWEASNKDKIFFPDDKITKQDVFDYYNKIKDKMFPFVENRILSIIRCPDGIKGECFFQKHLKAPAQGLGIKKVKNSEGETEQYFYIKDGEGIKRLLDLGVIEFHPWCAKNDDITHPDVIIFDIDPGESVSLKDVRLCAKRLKKILSNLSLQSFVKTSGGKGYHVVVPLSESCGWQKFEKFCKDVAILMEQTWPDAYTTNIRKENRKGKIFIDYLRNKKGQTSVSTYSLRARKGAPISAPISWSELEKIEPNQITIKNIDKRLKKDPWKNYFSVKQDQRIT